MYQNLWISNKIEMTVSLVKYLSRAWYGTGFLLHHLKLRLTVPLTTKGSVGGEECVREQLQATAGRGGTLRQEGYQAEGGHCPLQWYQGMYCRYATWIV